METAPMPWGKIVFIMNTTPDEIEGADGPASGPKQPPSQGFEGIPALNPKI